MERLGLWGEGTAFKSFDSFLASITKRGLGETFQKVLYFHLIKRFSVQSSSRKQLSGYVRNREHLACFYLTIMNAIFLWSFAASSTIAP